jgi:hypothetical protein
MPKTKSRKPWRLIQKIDPENLLLYDTAGDPGLHLYEYRYQLIFHLTEKHRAEILFTGIGSLSIDNMCWGIQVVLSEKKNDKSQHTFVILDE